MSEYYYIKSQLDGLVLTVRNGSPDSGTAVITQVKTGDDGQLWIDDFTNGRRTIRTKLNNFCLDIQDELLVIKRSSNAGNQLWVRGGELCQYVQNANDSNTVLAIQDSYYLPGGKVISQSKSGGYNEKWNFELSGAKKSTPDE